MSEPAARKTSRGRARANRVALREQGLRSVAFWLPDVRSPEFLAEAHRQSKAVAESPYAEEDQGFVDAISWWNAG